MTGPLLFALGDKIVAFLKRREEVRRDEYADFVQPAWEQFTKVHENYVSTFRAYRDLIEVGPDFSESHPVFARIATDTRYTAHLRNSLAISAQRPNDDHFRFGEAIRRYLERAGRRHDDLIEQPQERERWPPRNIARLALSQSLLSAATRSTERPSERRDLALAAIDAATDELQQDYAFVELLYTDLRHGLLEKP